MIKDIMHWGTLKNGTKVRMKNNNFIYPKLSIEKLKEQLINNGIRRK